MPIHVMNPFGLRQARRSTPPGAPATSALGTPSAVALRMTTNITSNDIHGVEHGWSVKSLDGRTVGSVEETTDRYILVKSGLLTPDRHYLPAAALEHVRPDMSEIGLSLTYEEIEAGDWSEPPSEGPRRSGAPLNVPTDEDVDQAMRGTVEEPEKPIHL